mmetsp:Transcript_2724/g.2579  ORF Transcript_2724/g.2579 Transcript_2724/m.2579 type:complete len:195 (-) Transcript_2724:205-789(-)
MDHIVIVFVAFQVHLVHFLFLVRHRPKVLLHPLAYIILELEGASIYFLIFPAFLLLPFLFDPPFFFFFLPDLHFHPPHLLLSHLLPAMLLNYVLVEFFHVSSLLKALLHKSLDSLLVHLALEGISISFPIPHDQILPHFFLHDLIQEGPGSLSHVLVDVPKELLVHLLLFILKFGVLFTLSLVLFMIHFGHILL